MDKLLVICGPTAIGKTALGIKLAKKFKGEIISADSRQVYKGMDIGTGKDLDKFSIFNFQFSIDNKQIGYYLSDEIPIWLYDVVKPDYRFTVADYVKCAKLVIKNIWKRNRLPILVGGTGFYIRAVVDGIETLGFPPDWKLRKKLQNYTVSQLHRLLEKTGPERWRRMNKSDRNNPRRLVRAIEIATQIKNLKFKIKNLNSKLKTENFLMIGLKAPNRVIYQRIDERVDKRVEQGVIEEIKDLLYQGYSWENSVLGETIGYQEWQPFFEGKISPDEAIKNWKYDEHGYARKQITWFKKDKRIHWFDITAEGFEKEVVNLIKKWYSKNDAQEN